MGVEPLKYQLLHAPDLILSVRQQSSGFRSSICDVFD